MRFGALKMISLSFKIPSSKEAQRFLKEIKVYDLASTHCNSKQTR